MEVIGAHVGCVFQPQTPDKYLVVHRYITNLQSKCKIKWEFPIYLPLGYVQEKGYSFIKALGLVPMYCFVFWPRYQSFISIEISIINYGRKFLCIRDK